MGPFKGVSWDLSKGSAAAAVVLIAYFTLTATTPALYILRSCEAATDRRPRTRDQAEAGDSGDHSD